MGKRATMGALVAALAVVASGAATASGVAGAELDGDSGSAVPDETLVVVGKQTMFKIVDLGRKGESIGDLLLIREALLDQTGNRVGRGTFRCMLQPKPDLQCDGAYIFRGRGKIAFANVVNTALDPPIVAPVIGGSGDFANVTGQLIIEFQGEDNLTTFELSYLE